MREITLICGRTATQAFTIGALAALAVVAPWGMTPALAATGGVGPVPVACAATGVSAPAASQIPLITATAGRDAVPEDDLLPVTFGTALPDLPPGVAVTGAHLTLPIPVDVSNVDLSFAGGTIEATSWDARSGTEIVIHLQSASPIPAIEAHVPAITVSYAFDLGSAGRTVHWPAFTSVATDVVAGGVEGTITCRPSTAPPALLDTALHGPVGLVRRGPLTVAEPLPAPDSGDQPGSGAPAPGGGAGGGRPTGGAAAGNAGAPAGAAPGAASRPGAAVGAAGAAGATPGAGAGAGAGDGAGGGASDTGGPAGLGRLTGSEALTQPVNLFLIVAVGLTGFCAAVLFSRRRNI